MTKTVVLRFVRVFVAGFLAQAAAVSVTGSFSSLEELKTWGLALLVAGIAGGLAALDKAIRFE